MARTRDSGGSSPSLLPKTLIKAPTVKKKTAAQIAAERQAQIAAALRQNAIRAAANRKAKNVPVSKIASAAAGKVSSAAKSAQTAMAGRTPDTARQNALKIQNQQYAARAKAMADAAKRQQGQQAVQNAVNFVKALPQPKAPAKKPPVSIDWGASARAKQNAQYAGNAAARQRAATAKPAPAVKPPAARTTSPKPANRREYPNPVVARTPAPKPKAVSNVPGRVGSSSNRSGGTSRVSAPRTPVNRTPAPLPASSRTPAPAPRPANAPRPGTAAPKPATPATITLGEKGNAALRDLQNLAGDYFGGSYDQATLRKWAADVEKGGHNLDYYKAAVKAGNATPDQVAKRAGLTVASELDPQLANIDTQMSTEKTAAANQIAAIKRMYELASQESTKNAQTAQDRYSSASDAVGKAYDQSAANVDKNYSAATNATSSELARLGLTDSTGTATAGTQRDQEFFKNLANFDKTTQQSSMSDRAQTMRSLNDRLTAGIGAESTMRQRDRQQAVDQLMSQLTAQKGQLSASRKGKVYTLIQSLNDSKAQSEAERQQQDTLNKLAAQKLGVSVASLQATIANNQTQADIARQRIQTDAQVAADNRKSAEARAAADRAASAARAAADRQAASDRTRMQVEAQLVLAERKNKQSPANYAGREGAQRYIEDSTPNGKDEGQRFIRNSATMLLNQYFSGGNPNNYTRDLNAIKKNSRYKGLPDVAKSMIQSALAHAYGK